MAGGEVTPAAKILIVENEVTLADLVSFVLRRAGFTVIHARHGHSALEEFTHAQPDLIILALNLPDMDGVEVLKRIRIESGIPIIVLTVRDADDDVVAALEAGADEYITKPFSPRQMVARVRAVLRRAVGEPEQMYHVGSLSLDFEFSEACWGDEAPIHLTPLETKLLRAFMQTPERVLPVDTLIIRVWGAEGATQNMLKQLVYRLRKKIEPHPKAPSLIVTIPYIGYKMHIPTDYQTDNLS